MRSYDLRVFTETMEKAQDVLAVSHDVEKESTGHVGIRFYSLGGQLATVYISPRHSFVLTWKDVDDKLYVTESPA